MIEEQVNNSIIMCKTNIPYKGEWDFAYPLIEVTDMNRNIMLNNDRFWGKLDKIK